MPQGRNDAAYFEPLGGLKTLTETELYFALVPYHPDDQAPGTTAEQIENIDAALINSPGGARHWGICTEWGWAASTPPTCPGCWASTARSSRPQVAEVRRIGSLSLAAEIASLEPGWTPARSPSATARFQFSITSAKTRSFGPMRPSRPPEWEA